MRRMLSLLAAGLAGALIALTALSFAAGAFAQGPGGQAAQPTPGAGPSGGGQMMGGRGQMGGGQMGGRGQMGGQTGGPVTSLVGQAAAQLGLAQADLVAKLGAEGTIAAALTDAGHDPAAFVDGFVATRAARLDAAVAAGTLTAEEAEARLLTARSMSTARIYQPFTALGPGGQGAQMGFVDADGDGVCDQAGTGGGRGQMGGRRGPSR